MPLRGVYLRHVSRLGGEILIGDELLYRVYGDGLVNTGARARVLTAAVADAAADGGEGVVLLYKLQRFAVAALSGHLYVALNGDVRGAGGLAGGRARVVAVRARVVAVVRVPFLLRPRRLVGQLLLGIAYLALGGAQLLAELDRAGRAHLNALAAGDAVSLVHMRHVCRAGEVRRVEKLAGAQRKAASHAAVAYAEDMLRPVKVRDLVHAAHLLGLVDYLHGLVIGDVAAAARLHAVARHIADGKAHILRILSVALVQDLLGHAAHTGQRGEGRVFFQPV